MKVGGDFLQTATDSRPLIVHLMHRFDIGGLENGVVNLINSLPSRQFRHAIVAMTEVDMNFARRVRIADVQFFALGKPPGQGLWQYPALYRLFRQLRPGVVHTRNFATLEAQVPAWAAGVPVRLHGEHGRDVGDLDGTRKRYQWLRRAYAPFVHRWSTVSQDLADYLVQTVGISAGKVEQIYNGVDADRFHPPAVGREPIPGSPFNDPNYLVVGTVGRMQTVKDQVTLARAYIEALRLRPALHSTLKLVMAGEGPLREQVIAELSAAGLVDCAWLPGDRNDVPLWMRGMDFFVLPSLAEGISNTILEAMACGLPVIATAVGGNRELVQPETTGCLVPAADSKTMAEAILRLAGQPELRLSMGRAARATIEQKFALPVMVNSYSMLYQQSMRAKNVRLASELS